MIPDEEELQDMPNGSPFIINHLNLPKLEHELIETQYIATICRRQTFSKSLHFIGLESVNFATLDSVYGISPSDVVPIFKEYNDSKRFCANILLGEAMIGHLGEAPAFEIMQTVKLGQIVRITCYTHRSDMPECYAACIDCEMLFEPLEDDFYEGFSALQNTENKYYQLDQSIEIITVCDESSLIRLLTELHSEYLSGSEPLKSYGVLGLDCEWEPIIKWLEPTKVSLLQLSTEKRIYVIDLLVCCAITELRNLLNQALTPIFSNENILKPGVQTLSDLHFLARSYPYMDCFSSCKGIIDLSKYILLAKSFKNLPKTNRSSLSAMCATVLGRPLDKREQCSHWGIRPLSHRQICYAAIDAYVGLLIFNKLTNEIPIAKALSLSQNFAFLRQKNVADTTSSIEYFHRKPKYMKTDTKLRESSVLSRHSIDSKKLHEKWLGKHLPTMRKESVVQVCLESNDSPVSKSAMDDFSKNDRHLPYVKFRNAIALLMNLGADDKLMFESANEKKDFIWSMQGRSMWKEDKDIMHFLEIVREACKMNQHQESIGHDCPEIILFQRILKGPYVYRGQVKCVGYQFVFQSSKERIGTLELKIRLQH